MDMTANTPQDPTEEEALELFKAVEDNFPSKTLGSNKWYILVVSMKLFHSRSCH